MKRALLLLGPVLASISCGLPSDVSDEFEVQLPGAEILLTVGDTLRLFPSLTRNGTAVEGFELAFRSSEPSVALVDGGGLLRGVGIGFADVSITPVDLANATPVTRTVRVLRAVTIDTVIARSTVSPDGRTVRWGEVIEIRGVGLDPGLGNLVFVGDRPARTRSFTPAPAGDEQALDRLSVWVPMGAAQQSDVLVSRLGGSTASWPLRVEQEDVFETSSLYPIDASRTTYVPELAIEVADSLRGRRCVSSFEGAPNDCYADGYTMVVPESGALTIEIELDQPVTSIDEFFEIESFDVLAPQPYAWTITPFWSWCLAIPVVGLIPNLDHPTTTARRTWTMPLKLPPGRVVNVRLAQFGIEVVTSPNGWRPPETMRYGLRVSPTYDSDLPPDAAEGNNDCYSGVTLDPTGDTRQLTFDNPWDLDWFTFRLPGVPAVALTSTTESEPNDLLATADTIALGTAVSAEIPDGLDRDYYAFYADAGELIDLVVRTPFDGGSATLDSFLQLYFGGVPIAYNDNAEVGSRDSRLTLRTQQAGWYTASVQQLNQYQNLDQTYTFSVRALGSSARRVTIQTTNPDGLGDSEFEPTIVLFRDERNNSLSSPLGLLRTPDQLQEILEPGNYLILLYNRFGQPANYGLTLSSGPVG